MKKIINVCASLLLLLQPVEAFAYQLKWSDLWKTPDQQGAALLKAGQADQAATTFDNKDWRAVANFRAGHYGEAYQQFSAIHTSDGQYNAGNAAAYQENYQEAINAYDKAIALNPNNHDAIANREIVKKLLAQKKSQEDQSSKKNNKDTSKNSQNNQQQSEQNSSSQKKDSENKPEKQNSSNSTNDKKTEQGKEQGNEQDKKTNSNSQGTPDQQNNSAADIERVKAKDEDKRQLLRRIADDPGGLLRQKFLRDYYRRHGITDNSVQGDY